MDKVISFGEALVDMLSTKIDQPSLESQESFIKFPGGAPANVAAAIGKLGGRSYFAGKVGDDIFGEFLRDSLAKANVNTDYLLKTNQAKTALAFVSLDDSGERSFEFYRNPSADLYFNRDEFQPSWFSEPGIFHFCSNTLTEADIQQATNHGIEKAHSAGFIISFDVNLRLNLWSDECDPHAAIWQCIEHSDIVKLSTEELVFLCRNESKESVIQKIQENQTSLVLITDGANKMHYYTDTDKGYITPPKVAMVDSTAAGDAFVGGLLYALAQDNISKTGLASVTNNKNTLTAALLFACRCGAYAVTHKGAFSSLPRQQDLKQQHFIKV